MIGFIFNLNIIKVIMKRKIYSDPEEVKKELQAIADELNLPINDEKVGLIWTGEGKSFTPQVYKEVLEPLYFSGN